MHSREFQLGLALHVELGHLQGYCCAIKNAGPGVMLRLRPEIHNRNLPRRKASYSLDARLRSSGFGAMLSVTVGQIEMRLKPK